MRMIFYRGDLDEQSVSLLMTGFEQVSHLTGLVADRRKSEIHANGVTKVVKFSLCPL